METTFTYDRQVSGRGFIGRKTEKEQLCKALFEAKNVAIYEGPKSGKSSLLKQCLSELSSKGFKFKSFDISLLPIRKGIDFLRVFISLFKNNSLAEACLEELKALYNSKSVKAEIIERILSIPYIYAKEKNYRLIIVLREFQNLYRVEDGELILSIMDKLCHNTETECSWVWMGSQVNGMKLIFEKHKFFYKRHTRVSLEPIGLKEVRSFISKGFLVSGKVIEEEQINYIYDIVKGNIYYLQHFAAICDGLSRGFITRAVVEESLLSLISIHESRFISTIYDLTDFQINLLKAILDGENKFSSQNVILKYNLNSSANVKRLKDALRKKEIITFEANSDNAQIIDPLFEYWLRKYYFNSICV